TLPIASHLSPIARSAARADSRSEVSTRSASASNASLASAFARNSESRSALAALRAEKNRSCAPLNRCHSASSTSLAPPPPARRPPLGQQVAARGPRRPPLRRARQFLRALAERLLGLTGTRAFPIEFGEMRSAASVERLPRRRVPLPQRIVGFAVQPADGSPL